MKRFICYMALFLGLILLIDRLSGLCFDYLNSHAIGGDTVNQYYVCKQTDEDILIVATNIKQS